MAEESKRDVIEVAKARFAEAKEAMLENHERMKDDLKFSNPADPVQWDADVLKSRKGSPDVPARPSFTFDQTNQYVAQVVNDARQNKPGIKAIPADDGADIKVAEQLEGIIRHIEYGSRAAIAYDTAIEHAARIGLGWLRVVPEIVNRERNEQEIRIKRVIDPLSVLLDPDSTEPDGSDAQWGFIETRIGKSKYKELYPKAKVPEGSDKAGWFDSEGIRVCEYFYIEGGKVKWCKITGDEVLEETEYPSKWIGLVPVIGYELWVDGKRYLCGMVRRMRDSQKAYNYERTAYIETTALQPKAPVSVPMEGIEGHEDKWRKINQGVAFLPYNSYTEDGRPIAQPNRLAPPTIATGFVQGGQLALNDIQASIGMYRANLGAPSNETSGRAINARQREGDTANFHYIDNLSRSIAQLGRIIVDMIPRIYDTARQARIMGVDGQSNVVRIDPTMSQASVSEGNKVVAINPGVGSYDIRVVAGPGYTTLRQESAEQLSNILQASPDLMPVLGGEWAKMQDWPNAEKIARKLAVLAPSQIQALDAQDSPIPPEAQAQVSAMQQQMEQMAAQLEQAAQAVQQAQAAAMQAQQEAVSAKLQAQSDAIKAREQNLSLREQVASKSMEVDATRVEAKIEASNQKAVSEIQSMLDQVNSMVSQIPVPAEPEAQDQALNAQILAEMIGEAANKAVAAITAPKQVIRDQNGLIVGVQTIASGMQALQ